MLFVVVVLAAALGGGSAGAGGGGGGGGASGGGGDAATRAHAHLAGRAFGGGENGAAELHYVRMHQGLEPDAVPSLVLLGVARSGSGAPPPLSRGWRCVRCSPSHNASLHTTPPPPPADLLRRLLARYPALQPSHYRESNFLTQCARTDGEYSASLAEAYCGGGGKPPGAAAPRDPFEPRCHTCTPLGYALMFNTTAVAARLGGCPLAAQAPCAGGQLSPDGLTRAPPRAGYSPVFAVDSSKQYSASAGHAARAAAVLAGASPRARAVLLLRNPADVGRALYDVVVTEYCGPGGTAALCATQGATVPYERLAAAELLFLASPNAAALLNATLTLAGAAALAGAAGGANVSGLVALERALGTAWKDWCQAGGGAAAAAASMSAEAAAASACPPKVTLFGRSLFLLRGLYAPVVLVWAARFARPGRPLLVVQSEAYAADPAGAVETLFGPFLFGEGDGMGAKAGGAGGGGGPADALADGPAAGLAAPRAAGGGGGSSAAERPPRVAVQSVAQRCAVARLFEGPNAQLEALLGALQAAGLVQLRRTAGGGAGAAGAGAGADQPAGNFTGNGDYDYAAENADCARARRGRVGRVGRRGCVHLSDVSRSDARRRPPPAPRPDGLNASTDEIITSDTEYTYIYR